MRFIMSKNYLKGERKMKIYKTLILVILIFLSCAYHIRVLNRNNLLKLNLGMTKDEVIEIMSKPYFNEAYQKKDGGALVIFFYETQIKGAPAATTKEDCTPLIFEDGKLIGWGDEFYQNKIKVELEIK